MKQDEKNLLLNWYYEMGVDESITNATNNLRESRIEKYIAPQNKIERVVKLSSHNNPSALVESARVLADGAKDLNHLRQVVEQFEGISIKKTATNTVFADGNPSAPVMIVGEAPGANEDQEGIPFCGQSGQLMDKMFSFVGLNRQKNLYITNSLFWRPPGNRKPTPEENAICLPFVEKHIALIQPKLLLLVGATAAQTLLNSEEAITLMRSKKYSYINKYLQQEIEVMVMYHPSYLLRQPSQKKFAWNDILKIKKKLAL